MSVQDSAASRPVTPTVSARERGPKNARRARNITLVLAFLAVLLAPALAAMRGWNPMADLDEKRTLAKKPDLVPWSPAGRRDLPAVARAWEQYFNDHFGLRKLLIGSYRFTAYHLLGVSASPAVVVGKSDGRNRWLFFDASKAGHGAGFESMRGEHPYSQAELNAIAARLHEITALVRAHGALFVIGIAPDKHMVYPQYLPADQRPKPGVRSRLDQFWAMAAQQLPDVPLLDLRKPLLASHEEQEIYFPSDTHWNWRGAFLAYQAIAQALSAQDPAGPDVRMGPIEWHLGPPHLGDLTDFMGVPHWGGDVQWQPTLTSLKTVAARKRGKLFAMGDSFLSFIAPYLDAAFEKVSVRAGNRGIREFLLEPGLLEREKPDVVLLESLERYWTMD